MGWDADMMAAPEELKKRVGWAAYAVEGARHLGKQPMRLRLSVDGGPEQHLYGRTVLVANVGTLVAGIDLIPEARPDDGMLDVLVIDPSNPVDWARTATGVPARPRRRRGPLPHPSEGARGRGLHPALPGPAGRREHGQRRPRLPGEVDAGGARRQGPRRVLTRPRRLVAPAPPDPSVVVDSRSRAPCAKVSRVTALLSRVGRWCAAHGWRVVVVWLLVLLSIGGLNRAIGGKAAETYRLPGTDAAVAQDLIARAFPGSATEASPLVLTSDLDLGSGPGAELVAQVVEAERDLDRVTSAVGPADNPLLLSDDGRTAIVQITVADRFAGDAKVAREVLDTAVAIAGEEAEVALGGFLGRSLSRPDTRASEAIGLAMALLVLFVTLRRFAAVLIPLVNAVVAVGVGLALVGLLGKVVFIPDVATTLGTMLGLGVGIDYALFLVVRHRLLLRRGFGVEESVARTLGTAGAAMVFAGGTLIAAVSGLVLTGLSFLAWLGIAAGIVVAVAVLASMTLVPAMLGIARARVRPRREPAEVDDTALDTSGWARLADVVTSRPWLFAVVSTVVLLVMAAPTVTLSLGHSDASILPETTTARQADDAVRAGFGDGESSPLAVVSQMFAPAEAPEDPVPGGDPRAQDPRLVELRETLAEVPGVVRADAPVISTDGGVATIRVTPEWGSADPRTEALVLELRDQVLPAVDEGQGWTATSAASPRSTSTSPTSSPSGRRGSSSAWSRCRSCC
jgi:hypothetical protein